MSGSSTRPCTGLIRCHCNIRTKGEFAAGLWPDKDLMTYRNGRSALAHLVKKANSLEDLRFGRSDAGKEAKLVVDDLLMSRPTSSPKLSTASLCQPTG